MANGTPKAATGGVEAIRLIQIARRSGMKTRTPARRPAAARRHHPDTGGDPDRMRAINAAWRVLRDPARRAAYDRQLAHQTAPPDTGWAPDKLADSPATGQTRAHGSWSAILPPATLAISVLLLVTAGYSASPPLFVLAGSMFAIHRPTPPAHR